VDNHHHTQDLQNLDRLRGIAEDLSCIRKPDLCVGFGAIISYAGIGLLIEW